MQVEISGYDMAFPVMTATESRPGLFDSNHQILGTAFYIGGGCLVTARHVVDALTQTTGVPVLVMAKPGDKALASITIIRDLEALYHDIGVIRVGMRSESLNEPILPWFAGEASPFDELWALGFPYGLLQMRDGHQVQLRCFRGHAVSNPEAFELPTDSGRPTPVYELSFQAPRGLSGGPLYVVSASKSVLVAGVIVGNSTQSMVVHSATEIDSSGGRTTVFERHESLHLGIAVQSSCVLQLESRILNGTIAGHLARRGAVVASD